MLIELDAALVGERDGGLQDPLARQRRSFLASLLDPRRHRSPLSHDLQVARVDKCTPYTLLCIHGVYAVHQEHEGESDR